MCPRNKSNSYVSGEQGTAMRPKSSRRVSAVAELNRLHTRIGKLEVAALSLWRSRGCGCCVDFVEQGNADELLAKVLDAKEFDDKSGYDLWEVADQILGKRT